MKRKLIIAIDGPAGSGKSSVAKQVAQKLNYRYIDTGAMYRAITWKALQSKLDINNIDELVTMLKNTDLDIQYNDNGSLKILIDGIDVTSKIRSEEISQKASILASIKETRAYLIGKQREIGKNGCVVMDGRDIGTVVFPVADKKFYLDALLQERTRRRFKELSEKTNIKDVEKEIILRDERDKSRSINPLKIADDAIIIDTTSLTIEEVVNKVLAYIVI